MRYYPPRIKSPLHGEITNAYRILAEKSEREWSLERLRNTGYDNIKIEFKETGYEFGDCIHLASHQNSQWQTIIRLRVL